MSTIKTWQENAAFHLPDLRKTIDKIPFVDVRASYMVSEIAELRAALAASGGNAAPKDQEPYAYHIHDNNGDGILRLAKNIDVHRFIAVNKVPLFTTESAPNAALVAALRTFVVAFEGRNPFHYSEYLNEDDIIAGRAALSAAGQEVGK